MSEKFRKEKIGASEAEPVVIRLLPPDQFQKISDGTELLSIFGERKLKGVDECHPDELRGGYMAVGYIDGGKIPEGIDPSRCRPQTIKMGRNKRD